MAPHAKTFAEEELVTKSQRGDVNAFGELVKLYQNQVYTLAIKTLGTTERADDVSQETFIRAWRAIKKFEGKSKFSSWLYRITVNCCISELRRNQKPIDRYEEEKLESLRIPNSSADNFEKTVEQQDLIERLLKQLPPLYRSVVTLHYLQGQSINEISEITGRPGGTIKAYLHRARAHLRIHAQQLLQTKNKNR